ncbi:MAG TPA: hypothetical protein VNZ52_00725 [Candidatus Thermoplasmatota archaeon]|nr:hypothetical protein [Candidatus Thermoplasmatota archaeon]
MATNRTVSILVYVIGLALVLAAVWVIFTQTGLANWIPGAIVVALVLLVLGLGVMSLSDRFRGTDREVVYDRGVPPAGPGPANVTYERETRTYDDEYRRTL